MGTFYVKAALKVKLSNLELSSLIFKSSIFVNIYFICFKVYD